MNPVDLVAVRPCRLQDAEALALVGAATFLESFAGVLPGDAIVQHCARHHVPAVYRRYLADHRVHAWLATMRDGDAPVGYAMLTPPELPLPDLSPADLELKRIYLFSRFQGTGVGQSLMQTSISTARSLGGPRLLLGVYCGNARAIRFYQRNGFTEVGTRTFAVGTLVCDDLILGLNL